MRLAAGTRLAAYEITTLIGAGGMGEVYRARDARLGRDVAVKVLPESLAGDAERLARFEREAKNLAALNHPNIAQIYGLEISGGVTALVMELIEGPTLADRLSEGAIPHDETLAIARQIAEGLEASHEQGIVHRDLKPANVKLRPDGVVKILDFGLAKLAESAVANVDATVSPTLTSPVMTGVGIILGTAAYMAPEQAVGKFSDKRADIWSFGVVLWEMLTGTRLFGGAEPESVAHVIADVLRAPIDLTKIPPGRLRDLLARCLERDVKMRLRDIGEARVALAKAADGAPSSDAGGSRTGTSHVLWPGVAAALALVAGVAFWAPWRTPPEKPLVRWDIELGPDVSLSESAVQPSIMLSPDGTRLAFSDVPSPAANEQARLGLTDPRFRLQRRLFTRRLAEGKAVELRDAQGASNFFFSRDSRWLAFVRGNALFKIAADGGRAVPVAEFPSSISDGDWAADGTIVIGGSTGIWRIPPGGKPIQVTTVDDGARGHLGPRLLPGDQTAVYAVVSGDRAPTVSAIEAVSLVDGKRKDVLRGGVSPWYLPTGHLLYMSNGQLFAIAFDPGTVETRGTAVPVLDDVRYNGATGLGFVSVSNDGRLVYRRGGSEGVRRGTATEVRPPATLDWIDAAGKHTPLLSEGQGFSRPRFSPDGTQVAVLIVSENSRDYWRYDLRTRRRNRITFGDYAVSTVAWSPDNRYVFFGSGQGGKTGTIGIFLTAADGAGQPQRLLEGKSGLNFVTSYSAAARRLIFNSLDGDSFALPLAEENGEWKSTGAPEPIYPTAFRERMAAISPDGRWIAYATDESGRLEVVVRPFKAVGGQARKWTISTDGGTRPIWSRDGRHELLYQERDRIMAVSYAVDRDTFTYGPPRVRVAKLDVLDEDWDVAPDGRIAAVTPVDSRQQAAAAAEHTAVLLENFFDEVKRRVK